MHFDSLREGLEASRMGREGEKEPVSFCDLIYLDDVISAMGHANLDRSAREAWTGGKSFGEKLPFIALLHAGRRLEIYLRAQQ